MVVLAVQKTAARSHTITRAGTQREERNLPFSWQNVALSGRIGMVSSREVPVSSLDLGHTSFPPNLEGLVRIDHLSIECFKVTQQEVGCARRRLLALGAAVVLKEFSDVSPTTLGSLSKQSCSEGDETTRRVCC